MIIAFKHGKLANVFDTVDEASKSTGVPIDRIQKYIINGDIFESKGENEMLDGLGLC